MGPCKIRTENEEKNNDAYRQKTEATGREKVGKGVIRKRRTQEEIATKPKIAEDKDTKDKVKK